MTCIFDMSLQTDLDRRIAEVRRFTVSTRGRSTCGTRACCAVRFLWPGRARLYELAHREKPTASGLRLDLNLDAGYLSRILRGFEGGGLVRKTREQRGDPDDVEWPFRGAAKTRRRSDANRRPVTWTRTGLLARERPDSLYSATRPAGGYGVVVGRHGLLYARDYGLDEKFEGLVACIVARFLERCWIAEREGAPVGSVFLVAKSARIAQLRMLLVEPDACGLGIGRRPVDECIRFARQAGYRKLVPWTSDVPISAGASTKPRVSVSPNRNRTKASAIAWWARPGSSSFDVIRARRGSPIRPAARAPSVCARSRLRPEADVRG